MTDLQLLDYKVPGHEFEVDALESRSLSLEHLLAVLRVVIVPRGMPQKHRSENIKRARNILERYLVSCLDLLPPSSI